MTSSAIFVPASDSSTPRYGECSARPSAASYFSIEVTDDGATPIRRAIALVVGRVPSDSSL
jgi:hypothetical protein